MNSRPQLRPDLVIVEQTYRGERTFIVKDPAERKYFRFRPVEVMVMQAFGGQGTAAEVAAGLRDQGYNISDAVVEGFARKLRQMGLLVRSLEERSVLLMERMRARRRQRLGGGPEEGSLLRMRWSIGDPDQFFERWMPRLRFCFTRGFVIFSLGLFAVYALICASRWEQLSYGIRNMFAPANLTLAGIVVTWGTVLLIVTIHELGHGFACKYFGGKVHEMGAMLLYFQPAFFCNVNDAWTFPELKARLWVTAAGSWIQVVVTSFAAILWCLVQPDTLVSQAAIAAILIGGMTTVLANANPLLPLDGYYALSDYLEIPNLRQRAQGYIAWLIRRHVLRLEVVAPPADERERRVFRIYGLLSLLYSAIVLTFTAALVFGWAARVLGGLGVLLLAVGAWLMVRRPVGEWASAVRLSLREHREALRQGPRWRRGAMGAGALLLVGLLPWPITVTGRFTVMPVHQAAVVAPESGTIERLDGVEEGRRVEAGTVLMELRSPELSLALIAATRQRDSLGGLLLQARAVQRADEAARLQAEWQGASALTGELEAKRERMTLRAPVTGVVLTPRVGEMAGRWAVKGEELLRLGETDSLELRIQLEPAGAPLVQPGQRVRLLSHLGDARTGAAVVSGVSPAAVGKETRLEARVRLPADDRTWRPGVSGEASVRIRRSTVIGALWWALRKRVRNDLLL